MVYFVTYDLDDDYSNEDRLLDAIRTFGEAKKYMTNSVLVESRLDIDALYNMTTQYLKPSDRIFICVVGVDAYAGRSYKIDDIWSWLAKRFT